MKLELSSNKGGQRKRVKVGGEKTQRGWKRGSEKWVRSQGEKKSGGEIKRGGTRSEIWRVTGERKRVKVRDNKQGVREGKKEKRHESG